MHSSDEAYHLDRATEIIALAHKLAKSNAISFTDAISVLKVVALKEQESGMKSIANSINELQNEMAQNSVTIAEQLLNVNKRLSGIKVTIGNK